MLSEKETKAIRAEARALLQRFGATLDRVKTIPASSRVAGPLREEGKGVSCDATFRELMFANAPHKNTDCIIAEKARW